MENPYELSRLFQRKNFLIKPGYQLKDSDNAGALSFIVYSIILALILFYPLAQEFYASSNIQEQAIISKQVLSLHTRLWPAIFIIAILMGLQIILISHHIFGPMYRFEHDHNKNTCKRRLLYTHQTQEVRRVQRYGSPSKWARWIYRSSPAQKSQAFITPQKQRLAEAFKADRFGETRLKITEARKDPGWPYRRTRLVRTEKPIRVIKEQLSDKKGTWPSLNW